MNQEEFIRAQRGPMYNLDTGCSGPFIKSLRRIFDTGELIAYGRSGGHSPCDAAWKINEPMSEYFKKLTEGFEIPPVLPKVDL